MLEFLRNTMRRQAGPSPFTESRQRHMMLEVGVRRSLSAGKTDTKFSDYLANSERFTLIQLFQAVVSSKLYRITENNCKKSAHSIISPTACSVSMSTIFLTGEELGMQMTSILVTQCPKMILLPSIA